MASVEEVLKILQAKARPDQLEGMARFAIAGEGRLSVPVPEMRKLAKEIGKIDSKAARWIAKDAIRELESDAVQQRFRKKYGDVA